MRATDSFHSVSHDLGEDLPCRFNQCDGTGDIYILVPVLGFDN